MFIGSYVRKRAHIPNEFLEIIFSRNRLPYDRAQKKKIAVRISIVTDFNKVINDDRNEYKKMKHAGGEREEESNKEERERAARLSLMNLPEASL